MNREEIKQSIEYKWRIYQVKINLLIYGVIVLLCFVVTVSMSFNVGLDENHLNYFLELIFIMLIFTNVVGFVFIISAIYHFYKAKYFLKNYDKFLEFIVDLNEPHTSYYHRGAVYYTVKLQNDKIIKKIDTNPYFSSFFIKGVDLEEYNNQSVIILYDERFEKAYIIKKIIG